MRFAKTLLILAAVVFFMAAVTFYLNQVIFPKLVKKIAIERIEEALKRRVEIGRIHFNWVRGFIIDGIKIYEKGSSNDEVFAQAEQVSFGVLLFPGIKHYRITIPFIHVRSPSVHLIRTSTDTWNFSDLYTPPSADQPLPGPAPSQEPSSLQIAWGGITISNGQFQVDDIASDHPWNEFFNNINLKLSLSYKGISYDFTAAIPRKNGFLGANVYYHPITQNIEAQIHLKNIDTASYLSLINVPGAHLNSGMIQDIDLNINHTQTRTTAQGDIVMKDLDVINADESFKGDIEVHDLDAVYSQDGISGHGRILLSQIETRVPGLTAGGSVQSKVADFELTGEDLKFSGSLQAQDVFLKLEDRQVKVSTAALDDIKIHKDQSGIAASGTVSAQGTAVQWPSQKLQGDFLLKDALLRVKNENDITLEGALVADHFNDIIDDKKVRAGHVALGRFQLNVLDQKNVALTTSLAAEDFALSVPGHLAASADSLKTDKLFLNFMDDVLKTSATLNMTGSRFLLGEHKSIEADPQLELNLQIPVNDTAKTLYKGSVTLSGGKLYGFSPMPLDDVELDVDFQNDAATINALSVNVFDTNVRVDGTVKNFRDPDLHITAEADELDLAKIKDLAPDLTAQYGLDFDGTSSVKVQYNGPLQRPSEAKVLAVASVKGASVTSDKLHQRIKNITGVVEATSNSVKWRDFTADFQGQTYNLEGQLENFKHPRISASLHGPDLDIKADVDKHQNRLTINSLMGKYLNAAFDSHGTIILGADAGPVFDLNSNMSFLMEDALKLLTPAQRKNFEPLNPTGAITITSELKGMGLDWKNFELSATASSPLVTMHGYKLNDMKIDLTQAEGKIKNLTLDGKLYDGTVHAVGSLDLLSSGMPYDLALNIDSTDMHKLKMDSPLKLEDIQGKFYLTTVAHGTINNFKNSLHATGSMAIRDGFLAEFNLFKGLLSVLNDALRIGQVQITDVDGNFTVDDQKLNTENLRLKGSTIMLLTKGWVNFDGICDLDVTVDLSSGIVPAIANDVLSTLNIRVYDRIDNPKFKKKISVPQVINSLIKNFLQ